jgi:pimeloyl-ACP methyl ester carboxylesterase
MPRLRVPLLLLLAVILFVSALPARAANIAMEEFMVPSDTAAISLYVRNRHPQGQNAYAPEKIVLFVHGGAYPAETTFDLPLGGVSWMEYIARAGYDVYLVDVRGYGRSTRPAEMEQAPSANPPVARSETGVRDVGSAIDFIKKRRNVPKIVLLGWSAGTMWMGAYTASHNESVVKLILYAPFAPRPPTASQATAPASVAYRTTTAATEKERWLTGVTEDQKATLIPAGWFEQFAQATFATDPVGSKASPPALRVPNGAAADIREVLLQGNSLYDASKITVPTMIVHGEWDVDAPLPMIETYLQLLTAVPYKRWVEIGGATHRMFMERNRMELFREVQLFLDDAYKPE